MSLILEALKKSEAERRDQAVAPPARRAGMSPRRVRNLVGGMVLIALLGALVGWWGSRQWAGGPASEVSAVSPAPLTAAGLRVEVAAAEPATPPPEETEREPAEAPTAAMVVSEAPPPAALVTVGEAPLRRDSESDPPEALSAAMDGASRPLAGGPESAGPPPAAGQAATSQDDLPRFNQLPAVRSEIGDLALNMLVYSARPEARFALINLKRFEEGDELQPGLRVREIRRDGVVLSHRGRDLLLSSSR